MVKKLLVIFTGLLILIFSFSDVFAAKQLNMSDEEFFGIWDDENQMWSTAGKLDYSCSSELLYTEEAAKSGDYAAAKENLLEYYRGKQYRLHDSAKTSINHNNNIILMDNIYTRDSLSTIFDITTEERYYSTSVLGTVKSNVSSNVSSVTFMLMGRYKNEKLAMFSSREGENAPHLTVMADGKQYVIDASVDTYIRAGLFGDVNFGSSENLYVRESGYPADDNNMRTFVQFNLEQFPSDAEITSATLEIFGKLDSDEGSMSIMLFPIDPVTDEYIFAWNNAALNTFSYQGTERLGFDFQRPAGADSEFMNVIQRFDCLIGLVNEYLETRDEAYIEAAYEIFDGYLSVVAKDRSLDIGYRMTEWPAAVLRTINSKSMTPERFTEYLKHFWHCADYLNVHAVFWSSNKDTNWGTTQSLGQACVAVYFPELADSTAWLDEIDTRIDYQVNHLINEDGSYSEATHGYMTGVLNRMLEYVDLTKDTRPPTSDFKAKISRFMYYHLNMIEPNGYTSPYGDGGGYKLSGALENMEKWGRTYGYDDLLYIGTLGKEGKAPLHTSALYQNSQAAVMRSGWSSSDLFMFIPWRKGGSHAHNDSLSMNLYAYGRELLVHSTEKSYSDDPVSNWQRYRRDAHNTIEVDSQSIWSQTNSEERREITTDGTMIMNDSFDLFSGSHLEETENGDIKQSRQVLFIKPEKFWIVSDYIDVDDANEHRYSESWHMSTQADPIIDSSKRVSSRFSSGGNLQIVPADPDNISAEFAQGYIASSPNKYTKYTKIQSGDATFDTVLYPTPDGDLTKASVERIPLGVDTTVKTALKIDFGGDSAYYYKSYEQLPQECDFAQFTTDASVAYIHKNKTGDTTTAAMYNGSRLLESGRALIQSNVPVGDIGIVIENKKLEITSSDKNVFAFKGLTVYAPDITSVTFNGEYADFVKQNGFITVGTSVQTTENDGMNSYLLPSAAGFRLALNGKITTGYAQFNEKTTVSGTADWNGDFGLIAAQKEIAQAKPVKGSSFYGWDFPSMVNNGDTDTSWTAETRECPQYVTIDLETPQYMSYIEIFWDYFLSSFDTYKYTISVSDDGNSFTKIKSCIAKSEQTREYINKKARFIRITVDETYMHENPSIKDVRLYSCDRLTLGKEDSAAIFKVGSDKEILTIDRPIRICLEDAANYSIGYLKDGDVYSITEHLSTDSYNCADSKLKSGQTALVKSGSDIILWTKNAATFVLYGADSTVKTDNKPVSPGVIDKTGGGGGGGVSIKPSGEQPESNDTNQSTEQELSKDEYYKDIDSCWARDSIIAMTKRGIFNGVGDKFFAPEKSTTRAEFITMLVRAAELEQSSYCGAFADVSENDWYANILQGAFDKGIMSGDGANALPNKPISREEASKFIINTLAYLNSEMEYDEKSLSIADFSDCGEISGWAEEAIENSLKIGIITGYPDKTLRPKALLTRAEAAVLIEKVINLK